MKRSQRWVTLPPLRHEYRATRRGQRVLGAVRWFVTIVVWSMALLGLTVCILAWFANINEVPVP